jgi:hypothetical protein
MFLLVIAAFLLIGFMEIVPLVQQGRIKDLLLYSTFFTAAFLLCLLLSMNIKIPSPVKPMNDLVSALFKLFSS